MFLRPLLLATALIAAASNANGAEWVASTTKPFKRSPNLFKAPEKLPGGEISEAEYGEGIKSAWYAKPTDRYAHGILGDDLEGGTLRIMTPDDQLVSYDLPANQVFEDLTPRIVDLNVSGKNSVVTILSDVNGGASIAVFGIENGALKLQAQTPYIGRPNRWLNIAGIEDFDGDGSLQIAEIRTPHIGGILRFWTWKKGELKLTAEADGFSNHAIGSTEQQLSFVDDFDDDGVSDLAVPSADRRSIRLMKFSGKARGKKTLEEIASVSFDSPIALVGQPEALSKGVSFRVMLEDGSAWSVHRQ